MSDKPKIDKQENSSELTVNIIDVIRSEIKILRESVIQDLRSSFGEFKSDFKHFQVDVQKDIKELTERGHAMDKRFETHEVRSEAPVRVLLKGFGLVSLGVGIAIGILRILGKF